MDDHRLRSNPLNREKAYDYKISMVKTPRIFFLSLEGTRTESLYFEGVEKHKSQLKINGDIIIEPLQRQDTQSAPTNVLALLQECIDTVSIDDDEFVCVVLSNMKNSIGEESVRKFIENDQGYIKSNPTKYDLFLNDCEVVGLDVQYKSYLRKISNVGTDKYFCLVIDRDRHNDLERCLDEVERIKTEFEKDSKKGIIKLYLSSPCFDFWLLLHHTNCKNDEIDFDKIRFNKKTGKKTYTEKKLSEIAGHSKTKFSFEEKYLDKVDIAIENSKLYETEIGKIKEGIGTNLADLFDELRKN